MWMFRTLDIGPEGYVGGSTRLGTLICRGIDQCNISVVGQAPVSALARPIGLSNGHKITDII